MSETPHGEMGILDFENKTAPAGNRGLTEHLARRWTGLPDSTLSAPAETKRDSLVAQCCSESGT